MANTEEIYQCNKCDEDGKSELCCTVKTWVTVGPVKCPIDGEVVEFKKLNNEPQAVRGKEKVE